MKISELRAAAGERRPALPPWPSYDPGAFFDELVGPGGVPRPAAAALWRHFQALGPDAVAERQEAADREMRAVGVTFTVYDGTAGVDRPWPFDIIPRVVSSLEWHHIETGLVQRLNALNLFIDDVYHDQRSVAAGVVPAELVSGSPNFRPECVGVDPPGAIWAHICGSDLVRDADGTVYVLEDNLRVPSGMSYLLENRMVTKHVFPEMFRYYSIEPVDPYIGRLANLLSSVSPSPGDPTIVVMTPGIHNSAYFEHAFLAQQLGVELVEGNDMVVLDDDCVYVQTIDGLERVDVIYRRIDDLFLDPEVFRPDSALGVPGLMRAWRSGRVGLVNAPGAGVADDKGVYAFVPDIIRFFLDEEPVLDNVPTLRCGDPDSRRHVLENLERLVVKPANESGGYGIMVGTQAAPGELARIAKEIDDNPRGWVAQPILSLSTAPTMCDGDIAPRHVDLRPFTLIGPEGAYVTRGGLTRVARTAGSLIVNSSQGGGSKDTWVVDTSLGAPAGPAPGRDDP
ncbi:MAG: circularly permuted type 2 ATP-grasp protein [Acidimicrobiales bacterium]